MLLFEERHADVLVEDDGIRKPLWHKIVSFNLEKFTGTLQLLIPH
jgi:hypothetical protein